MSSLASAVCSITATQRRRFFWAAWWTAEPRETPFQPPDAANGGAPSLEAALAEAEARAGRYLLLVEPYWARAWTRVLRGERAPRRPPPRDPARPVRAAPRSARELLGVDEGASLADIKAAYRRRALATHPDHGGDADDFRALHAAYQRLARRAR